MKKIVCIVILILAITGLLNGDVYKRQMPGNAQAQAARARTEVVDDGRFCVLQQLDGCLADDLAVGAGAEHAAAHLERKVHKIPLAQQVLQLSLIHI